MVFVLATSSLTGLLHGDHIGLREILTFITANLIIMTLWINETIYLNKYGERDLLDIFTIIASMFVVGQLSLTFSHDFEATALPFTIFLTLSYLLLCLQYYLRGRKIGFTADMKHSLYMFGIYLLVFFLALVAIYFNFWTYDEKSLLFFYLPFFISYFFKDKLSHDVMNFPHIVERCQLITIITFGETVIAILKNYPILELPLEGILLFFAMATLFIFYISQTYLTIDHHRKADATVLLYAHLVIVLGLNFFTVAMELFPSHHNYLALPMLIVGNFLFYSGILSTSFYNQQVHQVGRRGLFIYALILLIGNVALLLDGHSNILLFVILNLLSHAMIAYHVIRFRKANHSLLGEDI